MENFQGNYSKATKIKVPPGMKTQKLIIGGGRYHSSSVSPTSFDSENVELNAPILRYLCGGSPIDRKLAPRGSRSPLSAVENLIERSPPPPPEVYRTPVKAVDGEEVLVMDGVPLKSSTRFSGSESSGSSWKSLFKAEIFQSPEDSGKCRYSSKCQFARGKEVDHPTHPSIKNKTEPQLSRSYNNSPDSIFLPQTVAPTSSEATMPPKRRSRHTESGNSTRISPSAAPFIPGQIASPATPTRISASAAPFIPGQIASPAIPVTPTRISAIAAPFIPGQIASPSIPVTPIRRFAPPKPATPFRTASPAVTQVRITPGKSATPTRKASPALPVNPVRITTPVASVTPNRAASLTTASRHTKSNLTTDITSSDWSPQDDGIEVALPFSSPGKPSSRESVNKYINTVLAGLKTRRLPVFSEISSE